MAQGWGLGRRPVKARQAKLIRVVGQAFSLTHTEDSEQGPRPASAAVYSMAYVTLMFVKTCTSVEPPRLYGTPPRGIGPP